MSTTTEKPPVNKPLTLAEVALSQHKSVHQPLQDVLTEYCRARQNNSGFSSAHEGYAVILEEVEELWVEIKKKPQFRLSGRLREEALQVAAMALCFVVECDQQKI